MNKAFNQAFIRAFSQGASQRASAERPDPSAAEAEDHAAASHSAAEDALSSWTIACETSVPPDDADRPAADALDFCTLIAPPALPEGPFEFEVPLRSHEPEPAPATTADSGESVAIEPESGGPLPATRSEPAPHTEAPSASPTANRREVAELPPPDVDRKAAGPVRPAAPTAVPFQPTAVRNSRSKASTFGSAAVLRGIPPAAGENDPRSYVARPEAWEDPSPIAGRVEPSVGAAHRATETSQVWRPAWEVDAFRWPAVCDQLGTIVSETLEFGESTLRTALEREGQLVAICSAFRGEGRTTLAMCLARGAARAGLKTALVDADLDRPQLAAALRTQPACGWAETLQDEALLSEAAIYAVEDGVTLFPLRAAGGETRSGRPNLGRLFELLGRQFDLVLIDTGPRFADAAPGQAGELPCPVPAAIVVRDLRCTSAEQAAQLVADLQESGIKALGVVENFVPQELLPEAI